MSEKNLIKIPVEVKRLFNNDYLDFNLALKIFQSENPETKKFFSEIMPLIKEFLLKEFPIIKMFNLI